jgi:hypothetical protein
MLPISVPSAPEIYKVIAGIPLLIFALTLYWGSKNLCLTVEVLRGRVPLPSGSSPPFIVVGVAFYLMVLAAGLGATWFFLALETAQQAIISQDGIAWVDGPPLYRQRFIPWREGHKSYL